MVRSPRLSLTRRQLLIGIEVCNLTLALRREELDALVSSDADASAAYMAIRGELSPRGRLYHPVARRKMRAQIAVLHARRDIRELELLRDRLQEVLDKEQ